MADNDLRIGFVGCGGIGQHHLGAWRNVPGAKIVAVCDIKQDRADKAGEAMDAKVYYDYAEMLDAGGIDAVDICTYSGLHAEHGTMAAERGYHVMTEKPIDLELGRIDKLIATAKAKNVVLACIFQNRVSPEIQKAKRLIDEGKLGKIVSCSTYVKWWRAQDYYDRDEWPGTWRYDGGVLSNQGIHSIDQMCWLAGPVAECEYAFVDTVSHQMEAEDFGVAVVRFESGAHGVVEGATSAYPGFGTKTEIFGTKGSAVFNGSKVVSFSVQNEEIDLASQPEETADGRSDPLAISADGHTKQLTDFVQCIREGGEPIVSGESARVAVDALVKIYRKAGITRLGID